MGTTKKFNVQLAGMKVTSGEPSGGVWFGMFRGLDTVVSVLSQPLYRFQVTQLKCKSIDKLVGAVLLAGIPSKDRT
jgi:hypothetical protein